MENLRIFRLPHQTDSLTKKVPSEKVILNKTTKIDEGVFTDCKTYTYWLGCLGSCVKCRHVYPH